MCKDLQLETFWNKLRRCRVPVDFNYDDTKRAGRILEKPLVKSINIVKTRMYIV